MGDRRNRPFRSFIHNHPVAAIRRSLWSHLNADPNSTWLKRFGVFFAWDDVEQPEQTDGKPAGENRSKQSRGETMRCLRTLEGAEEHLEANRAKR